MRCFSCGEIPFGHERDWPLMLVEVSWRAKGSALNVFQMAVISALVNPVKNPLTTRLLVVDTVWRVGRW